MVSHTDRGTSSPILVVSEAGLRLRRKNGVRRRRPPHDLDEGVSPDEGHAAAVHHAQAGPPIGSSDDSTVGAERSSTMDDRVFVTSRCGEWPVAVRAKTN